MPRVVVHKRAAKYLNRLQPTQQKKIKKLLKNLASDPVRVPGIEPMTGEWAGYRRIDLGNLRMFSGPTRSKTRSTSTTLARGATCTREAHDWTAQAGRSSPTTSSCNAMRLTPWAGSSPRSARTRSTITTTPRILTDRCALG